MRTYASANRRQGFTLVELMVAAALIVFIMSILSEAFVASSKVFTDLKAAGDLAERLRTATAVMRKYLGTDHFEGKRRLSDSTFWQYGPPQEGYFCVYQGSPASTAPNSNSEMTDLTISVPSPSPPNGTNFLPSNRIVNASIAFTAKLRGNTRDSFFSASVPSGSTLLSLSLPLPSDARYQDTSNSYNAQVAEVAFFLVAQGSDTANGTPLYGLYMRQKLTAPDVQTNGTSSQVTVTGNTYDYAEISGTWNSGTLSVNTPRDLTQPVRRFGGGSYNSGYTTLATDTAGSANATNLAGSDLLLANVVSFEVRLLLAGGADFVDLYDSSITGFLHNTNFSATGAMAFDTWSSVKDDTANDYSNWATAPPTSSTAIPLWSTSMSPPAPIIKAVMVTLRIWDDRSELTRQVTIVVPQ